MSREIKIRYTYKRKLDGHIFQQILSLDSLEGKGDKVDVDNNYWNVIARDLFTGLKDKNGKEIYEGDILRQQKESGQKCLVYWDKDAHWGVKSVGQQSLLLGMDFLWRWAKVTEVIGNIYEQLPQISKEKETR